MANWFDGLVKNVQNFGGGIGNAIRRPQDIQTPFSAGIATQPQKKLTLGDIVPQLPKAYTATTAGARNIGIGVAQGIARVPLNVGTSVAQMGATALQGMQGRGSREVPMQIKTAGNPILETLFGKDPIKSYQGMAEDMSPLLKKYAGANAGQASLATVPIAGGMAALDLLTGGKSKAVTESIAKAGTADAVRALLKTHFGESADKIPQAAVDAMAAEKNPKNIAKMFKPGGIAPAPAAQAAPDAAHAAAMQQLHNTPLQPHEKTAAFNELMSVGEHDAAAKVAQATTHGHVVEALQGTQLHPNSPTAMHYALPSHTPPPIGTPLNRMDPAMMAHDQAATAEHTSKVVAMNDLLDKQKAAEAAAAPPVPASTVKAGPQRAGTMMGGKEAQLRARQAAYQESQAAEMAAREKNAPGPEEMAQMNANAEAPKPQKTTGPVNIDKLLAGSEKRRTAESAQTSKMIPGKESGSAHENVAAQEGEGYVGKLPKKPGELPTREGRSGRLDTGEPVYVHHLNAKGESQIIDRENQGEIVHEKKPGGDVYSRVHNQLLDKAKPEDYGHGNRDPIKTLQGRQKSGADYGKMLEEQITKDLPNVEDRKLLAHHMEDPSIKVPEHVQRVADQVLPIQELALHVRQAANPEVRSVENFMSHIVKSDKQARVGLRGEGRKVSTYSGSNQGRTLHMLEDSKGDTKLGSIENMEHLSENHYKNPDTGEVFTAHPAKIKDLQDAGLGVEDDAAKILGKYAGDTNRVKENQHFIDNLKKDPRVVPPGQKLTTAQQLKGYRTVNVRGLEGYRIPNKLAFQMEGAMKAGKDASPLLKGYDTASKAVTNTIFYNMVTHPLNMLTNFHVGAGSLSKIGPVGTVKALSQLKRASVALKTKNEDYMALQNAGLKFGEFANGNKPGMFEKLGTKLAGDLGAKIGGGADKANLIRQWYRANTKVIGYTDDHLKAALALAGEKRFGSLQKSVKNADKFMVDYGNSGAFERKVVSRFANFYPWVKGNAGALGHMAAHPVQNAGAITNLALTGAAWYEMNKAWQNYTGNKKASVRAPGMIGTAKDVVTGVGDISKGKVPSALVSHMNPLLKEATSQALGKDVGTGQPLQYKKGQTYTDVNGKPYVYQGKDQNNRLTHAASNLVAPLAPAVALKQEKKSPTEVALNQLGFNTPHKATEQAAPKIGAGQLISGINTVKGGTKNAVDFATAYKAAGGNKLLAYQMQRASGDHSMDSFFAKAGNSVLDPLSKDFKGFKNQSGASVNIGKDLMKKLGGSSLTYMQAQKLGGSSTYDKFFSQHPELDPSNDHFQGFKSSGSATNKQAMAAKAMANAIKYQNYRGQSQIRNAKNAMPRARSTASVRIPGMRRNAPRTVKATTGKLKIATVKSLLPNKKVKIKTTA